MIFILYKKKQNTESAETTLQRFKRLECELKELKDDLKEMNDSNTNQDITNFHPIELAQQVEGLQKQVSLLHLEAIGAKVNLSQTDNKSKKFLFYIF